MHPHAYHPAQAIIDCGGIAALSKLLTCTDTMVQIDACWALSNISAGSESQIQAVLDSDVFPTLIDLFKVCDAAHADHFAPVSRCAGIRRTV